MFSRIEQLDDAVSQFGLTVLEIPHPALFLASRAFMQYKRASGTKRNVLPDFLIGAHAATEQMPVLTRDVCRYKTYLPTVTLIAPSDAPGRSGTVTHRGSADRWDASSTTPSPQPSPACGRRGRKLYARPGQISMQLKECLPCAVQNARYSR